MRLRFRLLLGLFALASILGFSIRWHKAPESAKSAPVVSIEQSIAEAGGGGGCQHNICFGICTNVQTDNSNCGQCGRHCLGSEGCVSGLCQVGGGSCPPGVTFGACQNGFVQCAGQCCDSSTGNCGSVSHGCVPAGTCNNGVSAHSCNGTYCCDYTEFGQDGCP